MVVYWDTLTKDELKCLVKFAAKHYPWTRLKLNIYHDYAMVFGAHDQDKDDLTTYLSIRRNLERLPIVFPELIKSTQDTTLVAQRTIPMHDDLKRWRRVVRAIVKVMKDHPTRNIGDFYNNYRWTWE